MVRAIPRELIRVGTRSFGCRRSDQRVFSIVDDEGQIRALLERALREKGFDVGAVGDGLAGLEVVLTGQDPYDLVVTNNCMPRMEGEELVARIRAARPDLPIVHLDDGSDPPDVDLPVDVPNVTKPFSMEALVSRIEGTL